jgi:hypothetical protein
MTDKARITIAALATMLFLGAVSAAGLAVHGNQRQPSSPASSIAAPARSTAPTTTWHEAND